MAPGKDKIISKGTKKIIASLICRKERKSLLSFLVNPLLLEMQRTITTRRHTFVSLFLNNKQILDSTRMNNLENVRRLFFSSIYHIRAATIYTVYTF